MSSRSAFPSFRLPSALGAALALFLAVPLRADDEGTGKSLINGSFESANAGFDPWTGVDDSNHLHVLTGSQTAVNSVGTIASDAFSPSIAAADLNGDGLIDLIVADARGFFWYYPNSGTPNAPAFTHGEVMPIWLAGHWSNNEGDVIPRLQAVDLDGDKRVDLVAGDFAGELFILRNNGTPTAPQFRTPEDLDSIKIPTHLDNVLWCNYLSPFLYDWSGTGRLDLTMGDGTYSANSIYLFENLSGNGRPQFTERKFAKLIPGMGREHLTPQVVDWNNDGKPDIVAGERVGYVNVYLNTAAHKTDPPVFDPDHPLHVTFGTVDHAFPYCCPCVADLNGDGKPDIVVGNTDGSLYESFNIGTPGAPKFGPLVPIPGVYPLQKLLVNRDWNLDRYHPFGAAYGLLAVVNATTEPGFTPPPDPFKGQNALKFSVTGTQPTYFTQPYQPEDMERNLFYRPSITLQADTEYLVSAWVKTSGDVSGLTWIISGLQRQRTGTMKWLRLKGSPFSTSSDWTRVVTTLRVPPALDRNPKKPEIITTGFGFAWSGDGVIYFDDISIKKAH